MDIKDRIDALNALSEEKQLAVIAHLSHSLTVVARDTYEAGTTNVMNPLRLRAINEIQHRITSEIVDRLSATNASMPVSEIKRIFLGDRDDKELESLLNFAFDRALQNSID